MNERGHRFAYTIAVAVLLHASSASAAPEAGSAGGTGVSPGAAAAESEPVSAAPGPLPADVKSEAPDDRENNSGKRNRFAGSILLIDQSMTTNSFSSGSQLSYSPLYELWVSPRVYYSPGDHWKVGARFDFFKEMFTNHEGTTDEHETRVGDPWFTLTYSQPAKFINRSALSRWSLGFLVKAPLSKESRADGQYFALGPLASASIGFPLAGTKSTWFPDASVGVSVQYTHAFTRAVTPTGDDFSRPGQDNEGRPRLNDQVRSQTLAGDSLVFSLSGTVNVTERINLSTSYIFIDRFSYEPADATFRGKVVERSPNDTRLRQLSWFVASVNWDPIKELEISAGYYNLNTVIGEDGRYRNPFSSPESRLFLSATVNLDAIYDDIFHDKRSPKAPPLPLRTTALGAATTL